MALSRSLTAYLDSDTIAAPSCTDLGGCNCEGHLWLNDKTFSQRWCVLMDYVFHIFKSQRTDEEEMSIQILDSRICEVKKSRSKNFYFKIQTEKEFFLFGTDSKIDYQKWMNKLNLSAAGVKLCDDDGPVGGFTSGFIVEPTCAMKINWNIAEKDQEMELESGRMSRQLSSNSNESLYADSRLKLSYDRSMSENPVSSHPVVPPRKKSIKKSKSFDEKNQEDTHLYNSSDKNLEDTKISSTVSPDIGQSSQKNVDRINSTQLKTLHEEDESDPKKTEDSKSARQSTTETGDPLKLTNVEDPFSVDRIYIQNSSDYTMNGIKKIAEIERTIRSKLQMVTKIDVVLKTPHLKEPLHEFWDEYGPQILRIISRS